MVLAREATHLVQLAIFVPLLHFTIKIYHLRHEGAPRQCRTSRLGSVSGMIDVFFGKRYSHPCLHHLENSAKSDPAAGGPSTPSSGCPRAVSATKISNVLSGWSRQRDRIITNLVYYLIFRQRAILEGLRVKFIAEGDGF